MDRTVHRRARSRRGCALRGSRRGRRGARAPRRGRPAGLRPQRHSRRRATSGGERRDPPRGAGNGGGSGRRARGRSRPARARRPDRRGGARVPRGGAGRGRGGGSRPPSAPVPPGRPERSRRGGGGRDASRPRARRCVGRSGAHSRSGRDAVESRPHGGGGERGGGEATSRRSSFRGPVGARPAFGPSGNSRLPPSRARVLTKGRRATARRTQSAGVIRTLHPTREVTGAWPRRTFSPASPRSAPPPHPERTRTCPPRPSARPSLLPSAGRRKRRRHGSPARLAAGRGAAAALHRARPHPLAGAPRLGTVEGEEASPHFRSDAQTRLPPPPRPALAHRRAGRARGGGDAPRPGCGRGRPGAQVCAAAGRKRGGVGRGCGAPPFAAGAWARAFQAVSRGRARFRSL